MRTEDQPQHLTKTKKYQSSHHLVGPSNLMGSSLGEESLREGVKLPELDSGRLGLSLLLDCSLPQLISLVLHLSNNDGLPGIELGVKGREYRNDLLFGGAEVHLDLVDDAIQGVDGLPRLLLSLGHGDGVVGNLVLEGAGDLAQRAEGVARVLLAQTERANSIVASLAVSVDFVTNVLLAAGNPLRRGISRKGLLKGDLLVSG